MSCDNARESDCRVLRSSACGSPRVRTRSSTDAMSNEAGSTTSSTSSQASGVETDAFGFGRTE